MKEVFLTDLTVDDLIKLIDDGERFYVRTNSKSSILSEPKPNAERDAFWFDETPAACKPIHRTIEEQENTGKD